MNVMHARGKSDDLSLIDRHGQMMTMVTEEFGNEPRINSVVEYAWSHVG